MEKFANRISTLKPSETLAITAKAVELKKKGVDVIAFTAGQPDFDTPENIKDAAKKAMDSGFTKYTAPDGVSELKQAIADKFKLDNKLDYMKDEIVVSCGAKQSLHNIFQVLLNKGDEVLIPTPYWLTYPELVQISDGIPVYVKSGDNFGLDVDEIKSKVTSKTKFIVLNSPNNPSGAVFSKKVLKEVADIAIENNIYVISDEVYEKLIYDSEHFSIASINDEIKELTITVNAVSKAYSMTGWRIGYTGCSKDIAKKMGALQSQTTSNPCSISQMAALEAITGPQNYVKTALTEFNKRREVMVKGLNSIRGFQCDMPGGAFYAFPNISGISSLNNSMDFAKFLIEKMKVAVIPGKPFGMDENIRLSYATSMDNIKEGIDRIKKGVDEI